PGFWPTQPGSSHSDYTGPEACRECHEEKFADQSTTDMRNTAFKADQSRALHAHPKLTFDVGAYHYLIETDSNHSLYTVTNGKETLSSPLLWAFGPPRVGQSYLFKRADGHFYEARVTYFATIRALGFTPTRDLQSPKDVEEAMDRQVPQSEVNRCFSCHATAAVIGDQFDEQHLIPGVTCEACHGPGAKHVADMKQLMNGDLDAAKNDIFNSAHLTPNDAVDFCGACHSTWWDVKLTGTTGPSTARSAPYRLVTSKCWGKTGDARLVCTACHDPHIQLQTDSASYDHACLRCHTTTPGVALTAEHPGRACPIAKNNCASCHMPKVYVKEMHDNFTDHRIRIVRAGEAFPQ
ncbi:MAG TPA: multiheme c-type cytochrome, partial [Candidatus Acidoferrum sp.]|nr:multiheme c-type cytochrome [Candidatus Acidoferrum sp.]